MKERTLEEIVWHWALTIHIKRRSTRLGPSAANTDSSDAGTGHQVQATRMHDNLGRIRHKYRKGPVLFVSAMQEEIITARVLKVDMDICYD